MHLDDIKYAISILAYVVFLYPLKRFLIPLWLFLLDNAQAFWSTVVILVLLYMYDFNIMRFVDELIDKISDNDMWVVTWFFSPWVDVLGFPISPADILLFFLLCIAATKLYAGIRMGWVQIRRFFGDFLIVVLWVYYRLRGETENSVVLISKDEAKNILWMYFIILVVLVLSVAVVIGPNLMMATLFRVNTTAVPIVLNNQTVDTTLLSYLV